MPTSRRKKNSRKRISENRCKKVQTNNNQSHNELELELNQLQEEINVNLTQTKEKHNTDSTQIKNDSKLNSA